MKRLTTFIVIASLSLIPLSFAHEGATGVVKVRMDQMKAVAQSMKLIARAIKDEKVDLKKVANAASDIAKNAKHMTHLFPKESFYAPSEASLGILDDRSRFEQLAKLMVNEASELERIANDGEETALLTTQFEKLGETCKSCHSRFRVKK